ncbi:hypothetical protein ACSLOE_30195, partial [Escherichia coli]
KQKLGVSLTSGKNVDLIIFDEPTKGFDSLGIKIISDYIKEENIEKFKKYNFQKYPFVFTDVNYKNLINWNDLNKLLEKDILHYP